ncbi:MAG TPA: PaaI family thioesterase [Natrialbaceae archaeon]|nr:PaaI family thioesterase [Natrialbaceae archaeon]
MESPTERRRAFVEESLDRYPFLSWLGVEADAAESGRVVLSLPFDEDVLGSTGEAGEYVHTGVIATAIDAASEFALRTLFDDPDATDVSTTNSNVSYVRPATGTLSVEAEVVRAGGSVGVTEVSVRDGPPGGGHQEIAIATMTYRLFRG